MSASFTAARWPSAVSTTAIWALAGASIVFWGLRLAAPAGSVAPPAVASTPQAPPDQAAVARLLGAVQAKAAVVAAPEAASRFALLGVVADTDQQGAALIAVDGKPARPFRVGAKVVDDYVLQSLSTRTANLGAGIDSPVLLTLQLPTHPLAVNGPPGQMALEAAAAVPVVTGLPPVTAPPRQPAPQQQLQQQVPAQIPQQSMPPQAAAPQPLQVQPLQVPEAQPQQPQQQ